MSHVAGFIDVQMNYQNSSGVARTASYCGLVLKSKMTTCGVLIGCFEDNDNFYDWTVCMENEVYRGKIHAYSCCSVGRRARAKQCAHHSQPP